MARPAIQPAAVVTSVMLTQDEMVTATDTDLGAASRAHKIWAWPVAFIGLLPIVAVLLASLLPSTSQHKRDCSERDDAGACTTFGEPESIQFAIAPADAEPVETRLSVEGAERFGGAGQVLFVTVTSPELQLIDWFVSRRIPAVDQKSYEDLYGTETPQQQATRGAQSMRTAKETAEFVALQHLGYAVELVPGDVIIDQLVCLAGNAAGTDCETWAPADLVLDPGDKLLTVDGQGVTTVDDLGPILAKHTAGDRIEVEYERDGETVTDQIELIASPDDATRTIIGFYPSDTAAISFPDGIAITIDTDRIGGPSAGLAFTLTLLDELSPGNLLAGNQVAVTGTININGDVGAIGGLPSKASAVMQAGARYFLVPTSQGEADIAKARRVVNGAVEIIAVANVDEALAALQKLGGDPFVQPTLPTS